MNEEMVDVEFRLDKETTNKLFKKTKKEIIELFTPAVLEAKVLRETVRKLEQDNQTLETKLAKAESYVEQGRAMITSVMERWYEYDT